MHSASSILARSLFDTSPKIVNSVIADDYYTRCSFHHLLLEKLESKSSSQKILDEQTKQSYTYAQLARTARKCASLWSHQLNVQAGDYVLFLGHNSFEYLSLYIGAICMGAVPLGMPCTDKNCFHEISTKVIQHNVQFLVVNQSQLNTSLVNKLLKSISTIKKIIIFNKQSTNGNISDDTHHDKLFYYSHDCINVEPIDHQQLYCPSSLSSEPCLAVSTGGSCQWPPNLVLYNHCSLVASCETFANATVLEYRSIDKLLVYGPFEHLENLLMFLSGIFTGCAVVLLPSFDYVAITQAIVANKINLAMFPSNMITKLLNDSNANLSLGNLTKIIVFGGKLSSVFCTEFFKRYNSVKSLRNCYLIGESPCPISLMIRNSYDYDSVGYLLSNTKLKVVDPSQHNEQIEANRCGIVYVCKDKDMYAIGYLSSHSQHLIPLSFEQTPTTNSSVTKGVTYLWFNTNDIGFYDEHGLIYVHGQSPPRSPNSALDKIRQTEIENILLGHQWVEEACVIRRRNGQMTAVVVPTRATFLTPDQLKLLQSYLNDELNNCQRDQVQLFVKYSLLRNSNGRYVKSLLCNEIENLSNIQHKF